MTWDSIIGQDEVKQHLMQMVRENRLPHALMFCGPQGAGKLPLALAFARYLLCQQPSGEEPCGTCPSCSMLKDWAHPDLHFSFPVCKEKSTDHPVSDDYLPQWREQLQRSPYFDTEMWLEDIKAENQQITFYVQESDTLQKKLALKSSQGGRKVVIVWLPEKMGQDVSNKLLKLIEEPPSWTNFLLVSQDPDAVLGTIQSRVQRINVPPLTEQEIEDALVSRYAMRQEDAHVMAHISQGSFTQALKNSLAGNEDQQFFDLFVQIMRASYGRRIKEMHEWTQAVSSLGREKQKRMLGYFQRMMRESFISNFHRPEMTFLNAAEQAFSVRFAPFINEKNIIYLMEELSTAESDIEQNVSARMVFFDFALRLTVLLKQ